ncbi:hypothetical protein [Capnocytophaga sputigena]|uniref:hypothetical protein n=1 Tax=Capnocytophaga sputigena TaxID=1019 RepID=UPI00288AE86E|nr:hypothetical protein [Capnocytophaga sputigena]
MKTKSKNNKLYEVSLLGTDIPNNIYKGYTPKTFVIAKTKSAARQKIISYIENADDDWMPIGGFRFKVVEVKEYLMPFPPIIDKNLDFLRLYEEYLRLKRVEKQYKQLRKDYQLLRNKLKQQ